MATTADWTAVMMMETMFAFTGMPVKWLAQTSRKPPASPGGVRNFRNARQFESGALAAQEFCFKPPFLRLTAFLC
jgi:hypothetical protein